MSKLQAGSGRTERHAGAVSRQIKQLEIRLGCQLFDRQADGVRLNRLGNRLVRDAGQGLDRVAEAYSAVRPSKPNALSISAPPSFAQHWLMPCLACFDAGRDSEIAIEASQALTQPSWNGERIRLGIRFGAGPWPGVAAQTLLHDCLFPVCSPALLRRGPGLAEPADLAAHTLLHVSWSPGGSDTRFPGWREWLDAAGAPPVAAPVQQRYSLFSLALDQAIAGHGVALASGVIVADRLASGVLVRPFGRRFGLA